MYLNSVKNVFICSFFKLHSLFLTSLLYGFFFFYKKIKIKKKFKNICFFFTPCPKLMEIDKVRARKGTSI